MLTTIAYVALILGVILIILGYTVEPRALRPGWGCIILAIVLILISVLLTHDYYMHDAAGTPLLPWR